MDIYVTNTTYTTDDTGSPLLMSSTVWYAEKTDGNLRAIVEGSSDFGPAHPSQLIPYADVTEQQAIDWVWDDEDTTAIEIELDNLLDNMAVPEVYSGMPWVETYPTWAIAVPYAVDEVVKYVGDYWECVQAHTSETTWPPNLTPALWNKYFTGIGPWVQPTGAQDAYDIGDKVAHNGSTWESTEAANVWEPGVFGWVII